MTSEVRQYQLSVNGVSVHVAEAGSRENKTILFLHGYPQNHSSFNELLLILKENYNVMAIDLPGVGLSDPIASGDKKTIASFVNDFIAQQNLKRIILAGHDAGGMVTYAFIKNHSKFLEAAIIMNTAIPGVPPWDEVKRNPYVWHFAFYSVPHLPELLITGKERQLFDYFFDTLTHSKKSITESSRAAYTAAYQKGTSLIAGLNWYRAFSKDEKDNAGQLKSKVPLLYIRGAKDTGNPDDYIAGFKSKGIENVRLEVIPSSGHYTPDENPESLAAAIANFLKSLS